MTRNYFALVKWVIALFAILGPLGLYFNYANRNQALINESAQRASFKNERREIVAQVLQKQVDLPAFKAYQILSRSLPSGAFQGLPAAPQRPQLQALLGNESIDHDREIKDRGESERAWIALLFDKGLYYSGLPKRFAGLIELLNHPCALNKREWQQLQNVLQELWYAEKIDDDQLRFLIGKLPVSIRNLFHLQALFLGNLDPPMDGDLRLFVRQENQARLLKLPQEGIRALNQDLQGLMLELAFEPSNRWQSWGELRIAAVGRDVPHTEPFRQNFWIHLGSGLVLELLLLSVFLTLRKYEQVNLLQKQLLAAASHELRTPLAVMRQFAEMLSDRASQFPEKVRLYHRYILRENLKMQYLVEKLLSTARFEHLDLTARPEQMSLKAWLQELVESAQQLHEKPIRLEAPDLEVFWDGRLLAQAVMNLLENARIHGQTEVELTACEVGERICIEVRDFGHAPELKKLRNPRAFRQGKEKHSGLGLGLYLTDKIVTIHRGKLEFEDAHPGLRVRMTLPKRLLSGRG